MLNEGDPAPDVTLQTPEGGELRISDLRGRTLVLYFYPKDDTSGCTKEAQDFSALKAAFEMEDAMVLGVSKDPPKSKSRFIGKYDLKITLASDVEGSACEAYGVWTEKSMYGRKYMGIERSTFLIGKDGKIARIWRKVKVPGHAEEVLAAARAIK